MSSCHSVFFGSSTGTTTRSLPVLSTYGNIMHKTNCQVFLHTFSLNINSPFSFLRCSLPTFAFQSIAHKVALTTIAFQLNNLIENYFIVYFCCCQLCRKGSTTPYNFYICIYFIYVYMSHLNLVVLHYVIF